MRNSAKSNLINTYRQRVNELLDLSKRLSADELNYRPKNDFWTIKEHIIHIMDCEIYGYVRYRKAVAEPASHVEGFNEFDWFNNLDYRIIDFNMVLCIIENITTIVINHLLSIVDNDWSKFYIYHPERGRIDLEWLINRRICHIEEHNVFIQRNVMLYNG
jgi:DinB superfamily